MDAISESSSVLDFITIHRRRVWLIGLLILALILVASLFQLGFLSPDLSASAQGEPVCYPAIGDTYADSSLPDTNFGADQTMGLGLFQGTTQQMYLQFDVSQIPADATIISANVQIYMHYLETSENQFQTALHAPLSSWEELKLTWNSQPGMSSSYSITLLDTSPG